MRGELDSHEKKGGAGAGTQVSRMAHEQEERHRLQLEMDRFAGAMTDEARACSRRTSFSQGFPSSPSGGLHRMSFVPSRPGLGDVSL